ncbi:hypothetical protein Sa4125_03140 [Aureimonas sp. SA4125]|uniref:DUF1127 domain-containing protein n=1 Tax=Aureimonas sp. SA4125 TaxID=2826993 RepID=UPI001CC7AA16|nr:DUF1127 domain-containing protein [Aureimonas sp. SA4125]BDA82772.1 hypothetical protein Sa4125_03140 [Aureimonas sp. SA4125]
MTLFPRTLLEGRRARIPSPATLFAGAAAMFRSFRNRRSARRLADMPDYLLNDIGLRRDDVHEALNRGWREDPTFQLAIKASRRRRGL